MAKLNPLAFEIAIKDNATAQINKITKEFERLKDQSINVKVNGVDDLQKLLSLLNSQNGKGGASLAQGVEAATAAIKKEGQALDQLGQKAQQTSALEEKATQATQQHTEAIRKQKEAIEEVMRSVFKTGRIPSTMSDAQEMLTSKIVWIKKQLEETRAYAEKLNKEISSLGDKSKVGSTIHGGRNQIHDTLDQADKLFSIMKKINSGAPGGQIQLGGEALQRAIEAFAKFYKMTTVDARLHIASLFSNNPLVSHKYEGGLTTTHDLYYLNMLQKGGGWK